MNPGKPVFLLFDGNALVHRAFHALPALTVHRTGEMVNGVKGFAQTLLKVLKEIRPAYWAITFDRPAPTFRHEKFVEYKQQRPATPQELVNQIQRVHELARAFHLPIFEMDGYEADDILATLSRKARQKELKSVIVTGDNDLLQVVSPDIQVLAPRRGFSDTVLYDETEVEKKYGLKPSRLIDFKALTGDSSDNIPGVRGIGEKTAVKLLLQFGDLEHLYERIDEVQPQKLQDALRESRKLAFRNRELVTIIADMPLDFNLEDCKVSAYDRQQVVELFRDLEFVSLLNQLPQEFEKTSEPTTIPAATQGDFTIIETAEALEKLAAQLAGSHEFAVDLGTSSMDEMSAQIVDFSFAMSPGQAYCVPVGHRSLSNISQLPLSDVVGKLKAVLEDTSIAKIAHNGKFDVIVMAQNGICTENLAFDTMLAAYVLGEKSLSLKALAFNRLGVEMQQITDLIGTGAKQKSLADFEPETTAAHTCADADTTFRLKQLMQEELKQQGLWKLFNEVEIPLLPVLVAMERAGVAIDTALLQKMSNSFGEEMLKLEKEIYNSLGHQFNINSSQQLSEVLFSELNLPKPKKTKSGYSTDASVLEELRGYHPMINLVLQYRQLAKLKSTYTDAFLSLVNPVTGRLHTSFNQTGTTTGRLSSSEPNLQNLPIRTELGGKIRQAIIAPEGCLLMSADYSQIDLRALAHISKDKELIDTFLRDEDVHRATAARVFNVRQDFVTPEMRRVAKTVNFGVIYGMSDYGLEQATSFSREEASTFIKAYFARYPGVLEYMENTKKQARELGYVETVLGRRRYIPEINSPNRQVREAAERMAINMPVQGTSADIIKIAMINISREMKSLGLSSRMLLQVHDELVFEVAAAEADEMRDMVAELMHGALKLSVPLKVDVKLGRNWGEIK